MDGVEYEGEINNVGKRDGRGIGVWPNGWIYEGHWKNGICHGKGRRIDAAGSVFEGDWVLG